jgi:hypothetical protein
MGVAVVYADRQQHDTAFCMYLEMVITSFLACKISKKIPGQAHRFSAG